MKFRTISRTRHAGRRARSRQVIKQRADGRRRRAMWCGVEEGQKRGRAERGERWDGTGRDGRRKEAPENSLRRLADFAPRRFPCPVNRKAGYSFRGGGRGGERMGLSTFPLLYTLHRAYIPRQVDQSCAVFVALSFSLSLISTVEKYFFVLFCLRLSFPLPLPFVTSFVTFFYFKMSNVLSLSTSFLIVTQRVSKTFDNVVPCFVQ